ncbi:hypothetical protein JCM8097_000044 [Rhodosporidiobolus ruineniae]
MIPSPSGACCVCSKETIQRCSACGKAGFDLFFCSTEHQRMVWFAHKQVCGPKSKPFSFPLLSPEEAEEAKQKLHTKYDVQGRTHQNTLEEDLTALCGGFKPVPVVPSMANLLDILQEISFSRRLLTLDQRNELVCQVRVSLHTIKHASLPGKMTPEGWELDPDAAPHSIFSPISAHAAFADSLSLARTKRGLPRFPSSDEWYIKLQHHALVLCALRYLKHQNRLSSASSSSSSSSSGKTRPFVECLMPAARPIAELVNGLRGTRIVDRLALIEALEVLVSGTEVSLVP